MFNRVIACFCLLAAFGLTVSTASAANVSVVNWYGDYLTLDDTFKASGNRLYRDGASPTSTTNVLVDNDHDGVDELYDASLVYGFSLDTPMVPQLDNGTVHARYIGDAPSAMFYGGIVGLYNGRTPGAFDQATIEDSGRNPLVTDTRFPDDKPWRALARTPTPTEGFWSEMTLFVDDGDFTGDPVEEADDTSAFYAAFIWKKDGFLNGGDSQQVFFDADSSMSFDRTRYWEGVDGLHFIAQDGDQFYISQGIVQDTKKYGDEVFINPMSTMWAEYDPQAGMDFNFDQINATWLDPMVNGLFTDLQSFGIYFETDVATAGPIRMVWDHISVAANVANVVPLPSGGLMGGGLIAVMACMRRRYTA